MFTGTHLGPYVLLTACVPAIQCLLALPPLSPPALALTYSISGRVVRSEAVAEGIAGVTMTLSGDLEASTTTGAEGNYEFSDLPAGDYVVSPSKVGYAFTPASRTFTDLDSDKINQTFLGSVLRFSLNGAVKDGEGQPIAEASVEITGDVEIGFTTGPDGRYQFADLLAGNYTVAPSKAGWAFSPTAREYLPLDRSKTGEDFTGTFVGFRIGGCAVGTDDYSIPNVVMTLAGDASAVGMTDANGHYEFDHLPLGSYTISPLKPGWSFEPAIRRFINLRRDHDAEDFAGTAVSSAVRLWDIEEGLVVIEVLPLESGTVALGIFDTAGRKVWSRALQVEGARDNETTWGATNSDGQRVSPGIYVLRAVGAGIGEHKKFLLAR